MPHHYFNMENNTPLAAAKQWIQNPIRCANAMGWLFNSEWVQSRLGDRRFDINAKDIAAIANSSDPMKAFISWGNKMGMAPTVLADVAAILLGGTAFYLNQLDYYKSEGYEGDIGFGEAHELAYRDFKNVSNTNQQSGEQHMTSQLQHSDLGKVLFAFQNTPFQYTRIIKNSTIQILKGHGDPKAHIANIAFYGAIQSFIFAALQTALFAALDDEDDQWDKKSDRVVQSMIDTILNGSGLGGKVIVTVKNGVLEYQEQESKDYNPDHTYTIIEFANMSPPLGSKLRKIYSAIQTRKYNKDAIAHMNWYDPDNPEWAVVANLIEAFTNVPTARVYNKQVNVRTAINGLVRRALNEGDGTEEDF